MIIGFLLLTLLVCFIYSYVKLYFLTDYKEYLIKELSALKWRSPCQVKGVLSRGLDPACQNLVIADSNASIEIAMTGGISDFSPSLFAALPTDCLFRRKLFESLGKEVTVKGWLRYGWEMQEHLDIVEFEYEGINYHRVPRGYFFLLILLILFSFSLI